MIGCEADFEFYCIFVEMQTIIEGLEPDHDVHYMDEDTAECPLLRLIEPEDLPRDDAPLHPVLYTHQTCFCLESFISDDPEEKHQAGDGGDARRVRPDLR